MKTVAGGLQGLFTRVIPLLWWQKAALQNLKKLFMFHSVLPSWPATPPSVATFLPPTARLCSSMKRTTEKELFLRAGWDLQTPDGTPQKMKLLHTERNTSGWDLHLVGREKILSHPILQDTSASRCWAWGSGSAQVHRKEAPSMLPLFCRLPHKPLSHWH